MKASFNSPYRQALRDANDPTIPQWVSDMGLEWLYALLSKPALF